MVKRLHAEIKYQTDTGNVVAYHDYATLEARVLEREEYTAKLEERTDKALTEHAAGCIRDQERIAELEAALREAMEWDWLTDAPPPKEVVDKCEAALGSEKETPAESTLCAVCDQIKELHPSTHPWTSKNRGVAK